MTAPSFTDPHRFVWTCPDMEVVVGEYLKIQLGALAAAVYTALPSGVTYEKPVYRINRIGGVRRGVVEEVVLDIDAWRTKDAGGAITSLKASVATARAEMMGMKGVRHRGIVVTRAWEVAGPVRRPEEDTALGRLGFTVGLLVHPA